jgi:hypothetical protein
MYRKGQGAPKVIIYIRFVQLSDEEGGGGVYRNSLPNSLNPFWREMVVNIMIIAAVFLSWILGYWPPCFFPE